MRQLCNIAYAVLTEGLDKDDILELDDKLNTIPGEEAPRRSRGTEALMGIFKMPGTNR